MSNIYKLAKCLDPCGDDAPDKEWFEALLYRAIGDEHYDLMDVLISARYFGMRVEASAKLGHKLTNLIPDFRDHYHEVMNRHKEYLISTLKELEGG